MPDGDLTALSAAELLEALRSREVSALELLEAHVARRELVDGRLNSVVTSDLDRAMDEARKLDADMAVGRAQGPLHGLPMTVKDTLETAGLRTTSGAVELSSHVPAADAEVVGRMRSAGAVVWGKTNTPPWAGDYQTTNAIFGRTSNPWDLSRTAGGSSGGAAAALAAGITPLEIGGDIGGSLRGPASHCGVTSHKPTHGVISTLGHVPGPPGTLATPDIAVVGPMARTVGDLRLAMQLLAGPDSVRERAWRLSLPEPRLEPVGRQWRVASLIDLDEGPIDSAVRLALSRATQALANAGVLVDHQPTLPWAVADLAVLHRRLMTAQIAGDLPASQLPPRPASASPLPSSGTPWREVLPTLGRSWAGDVHVSHREWLELNELRHRLRRKTDALFETYDALLMPAFAVPAFPHDDRPDEDRDIVVDQERLPYAGTCAWWAGPASALGLPATVVPAGLAPGGTEGLPVGMQVVGPYLGDLTTLAFAEFTESVLGRFSPSLSWLG